MRIQPITRDALVAMLTRKVSKIDAPWVRIAIDGAPAAQPGEWAQALVNNLDGRGVHISTTDFLRPASLRYEFGRTNPDSYYESWFDLRALAREVLTPLGPKGNGRILTRYWDSIKDRSARAEYQEMPLNSVAVISGPLLLGAGLEFDIEVRLELSKSALERKTPEDEAWTLPAFERYAQEVPAADFVIRVNDPAHPALVTPGDQRRSMGD